MTKKIGALAAMTMLLIGTSAFAKPTIVEFDVPNADQGTYVSAIGKKGDVSGVYVAQGKASGYTRHRNGSISYLDPTRTILPEAINQHAETAGYTLDAQSDAFVADADGNITTFSAPGASASVGTSAEAIDAKGDVAGYFGGDNFVYHGFLRSKRGKFKTFDAPGAGTGSRQGTFVYGLTPDGIAGGYTLDGANVYHGFLRAPDGSFTGIDVSGAGSGAKQGTRVLCMNASGTVGGYYKNSGDVQHGFLRDIEGNFTIVDVAGALATVVKAVNKKGVAAGFYTDKNGIGHGFVRTVAGKISAIDAPDAGASAGTGTTATAIDDKGEIAGYYLDDASGQHGFIRMP